jgi:hypothetical protein
VNDTTVLIAAPLIPLPANTALTEHERDLARQAIHRITGGDPDILDALGLSGRRPRGRGYDNRFPWRTAPPGGRGIPRTACAVADRIHQYAALRAQGVLPREAARAMEMHPRTARRYEARLIAAGAVRDGDALRLPDQFNQEAA